MSTRAPEPDQLPAVRVSAPVVGASQATAIEQARAVAEVHAAVVVAQQVPRHLGRAEADMLDACSRTGLAERAFYSVPRKGGKPVTGSTVHLMRELARIFGNVQYGVHELRRDDDAGESEVQAFAWDVQTNVRSTRTFVVPHARMKAGGREKLTDLGDIYLNNQNVGARAVRECIATILPAWFTDLAEDTCRETLRRGDGKPLEERRDTIVRTFAELPTPVPVRRLEARFGERTSWTPHTLAQLKIIGRSLRSGESTVDDEFPESTTSRQIEQQAQAYASGVADYDPAKEPPGWDQPAAVEGEATKP